MVIVPKASLYFHIPFCRKKCPYCHFYVLAFKASQEDLLIDALEKEWQQKRNQLSQFSITSIYFGGGTPTQLSPKAFEKILSWIHRDCKVDLDCEITLEGNPEDITPSTFPLKDYLSFGINRISLGVQSFDDTLLKVLGRGHLGAQAKAAIEKANNYGFSNITIDLMYETPHQTLESWEKTLLSAISLPISHISLYNLTFEKGAAFFRKQKSLLPLLPSEADSTRMFQLCDEILPKAGLNRYEISAFAKNKKESRHNLGYWQGRSFLGFGPSAFSYWDKKRFQNIANLKKYNELLKAGKSPIDFSENLEPLAHQAEMLAVGLRPLEGIDISSFEARYGALSPEIQKALKRLEEAQFIKLGSTQKISLTPKGRLFHDTVAEELIRT